MEIQYLMKINIVKEKVKNNWYIELIEEKKELQFNTGLAILRPILQFFVILTHCYNYNLATDVLELLIIKFNKFGFHVLIDIPSLFILTLLGYKLNYLKYALKISDEHRNTFWIIICNYSMVFAVIFEKIKFTNILWMV